MTTEEEKAIAAYRAMQEGGAKGGAAGTGDSKRRSAEHYADASRKAALGRAKAKGLKLYSIHFASGEQFARVTAPDNATAREKGKAKLPKDKAGARISAREIKG